MQHLRAFFVGLRAGAAVYRDFPRRREYIPGRGRPRSRLRPFSWRLYFSGAGNSLLRKRRRTNSRADVHSILCIAGGWTWGFSRNHARRGHKNQTGDAHGPEPCANRHHSVLRWKLSKARKLSILPTKPAAEQAAEQKHTAPNAGFSAPPPTPRRRQTASAPARARSGTRGPRRATSRTEETQHKLTNPASPVESSARFLPRACPSAPPRAG